MSDYLDDEEIQRFLGAAMSSEPDRGDFSEGFWGHSGNESDEPGDDDNDEEDLQDDPDFQPTSMSMSESE